MTSVKEVDPRLFSAEERGDVLIVEPNASGHRRNHISLLAEAALAQKHQV